MYIRPIILALATIAPLLLPSIGQAQSSAATDDLISRVRGAPGSRVGGATRGIGGQTATPAQPAPTTTQATAPAPRRAAPAPRAE